MVKDDLKLEISKIISKQSEHLENVPIFKIFFLLAKISFLAVGQRVLYLCTSPLWNTISTVHTFCNSDVSLPVTIYRNGNIALRMETEKLSDSVKSIVL